MNYTIKNMNKDILIEIISWKYDGRYSQYNIEPYDDLIKRKAAITNPERKLSVLF